MQCLHRVDETRLLLAQIDCQRGPAFLGGPFAGELPLYALLILDQPAYDRDSLEKPATFGGLVERFPVVAGHQHAVQRRLVALDLLGKVEYLPNGKRRSDDAVDVLFLPLLHLHAELDLTFPRQQRSRTDVPKIERHRVGFLVHSVAVHRDLTRGGLFREGCGLLFFLDFTYGDIVKLVN